MMLIFSYEIQLQDFLICGFVIKVGLYHLVELVLEIIIVNLEWFNGVF